MIDSHLICRRLSIQNITEQSMVFILAALLIGIYANAIRIVHSDDSCLKPMTTIPYC